MGQPLAAIFDFDGVLVNSARLHDASWSKAAEVLGFPPPRIPNIGSLGVTTEYVITELLGWTRDPVRVRELALRKEEIFRHLVREQGIDAIPGVREFLGALKKAGIHVAVGSSAPRANIVVCLEKVGMLNFFDTIVSGEDGVRSKPAPDIFLKAASNLNVVPARCVVFEDAPAGVEAAKRAGMNVVAVLTNHDRAELAGADAFITDFTGVSAAMVQELLNKVGSREPSVHAGLS